MDREDLLTNHAISPNDLACGHAPSRRLAAAIIVAASLTVFVVGMCGAVTTADEVHHYGFALSWARQGLLDRPTFNPIYESGEPPGYYYNGMPLWAGGLASIWQVTGIHQWIAQLYQAAWFALLLTMVYLLGRRMFDPRGAVVALLMALSMPLFTAFSVLLYVDVPTTALVMLCMVLICDRHYVWAGLAMGLAYLSKQNAWFLLPPLSLWIAWRETFGGEGPWPRRLGRMVAAGLMFGLPMFLIVLPDVLWRRAYLPRATNPVRLSSIAHRAGVIISKQRLASSLTDPINIGTYFGGLVCLAIPVYFIRRAWKKHDVWIWLCLALYLAAMTVVFSINTDIRYTMPAAPLLALIAARGLQPLWNRRYVLPTIGLIAALQFAGVVGYTMTYRQLSDSQQAVFTYLREQTPKGTLVLYPGEVLATEAERPPVWANLLDPQTGRCNLPTFLHKYTPQQIADTLRGDGIRYAVVEQAKVYDDARRREQNGYPQSFVERLKQAPGLELVDGPWQGILLFHVTDAAPPPNGQTP
ncbi:MAG: glycosyltransferase family 39 protein [Planctomycetes bacterium]|nr:glycosyltransferase family 39 protein [Planctomycetota bacterium]